MSDIPAGPDVNTAKEDIVTRMSVAPAQAQQNKLSLANQLVRSSRTLMRRRSGTHWCAFAASGAELRLKP